MSAESAFCQILVKILIFVSKMVFDNAVMSQQFLTLIVDQNDEYCVPTKKLIVWDQSNNPIET